MLKDTSVLQYKEELEQALCKLISLPSVKGEATKEAPFGVATLEALQYVLGLAREMGFETEIIEGAVGYVHWQGTSDEYVGSICHLDVVPAGTWEKAFQPQITEDKIIGRGSIDDKGPALTVLYAMKALKDEGFQPKHSIRLVLGLDEECGMSCLKIYNQHCPAPKASFTADADFPIIHAEKGIAQISFHFTWPEQQNSRLVSMHGGSARNVIAGDCVVRSLDENGILQEERIQGKMGHASMPHTGINAISLAAMKYAEHFEHPFLRFYKECILHETNGNHLGIACKDEDSGELTLNVGLLSLEGNKASLSMDIRYPVTIPFTALEKKLKLSAEKYGATYSLDSHALPLYREKTHPLVQTLMSAYVENTGDTEAKPIAIGGGTYARAISNCLAFGPVMPGDPCLCHQTDEFVYRSTLIESLAIYKSALKKLSLLE